jgi:serine/threonine protein kinase
MYWSLVNKYHVLPSLIVTAAFHIANIYVQYDVDDEYIIFNPFNIDETLIMPIYHQHIKNILLLDKSSLIGIKTRFIKKIQPISTTYEQFIRFIKLLSKCNSCEFSDVISCDQTLSPEKIYPNGKIPFVDVKDYKKIKSIGSGSYGKVYVTNMVGRSYAMKIFGSQYYDEGISSQYLRELSVLLNIRHENVIEITGILSNLRGFLMELMDDNLKNYYDTYPDVVKDHSFQLFITNKLLLALNYLHSRGIMNRDIKPQNILVKGTWGTNFEVKICDFGLCRGMGIAISGISATSEICTLWYRPIEILLGSTAHFGPTIDIWSLGCTLYETFMRKVLFYGDCDNDQVFAIFKIKGTPDETHVLRTMPDFPKNVSKYKNIFDGMFECFDKNVALVIKSALEYDPLNRPSASSLLEFCKIEI